MEWHAADGSVISVAEWNAQAEGAAATPETAGAPAPATDEAGAPAPATDDGGRGGGPGDRRDGDRRRRYRLRRQ